MTTLQQLCPSLSLSNFILIYLSILILYLDQNCQQQSIGIYYYSTYLLFSHLSLCIYNFEVLTLSYQLSHILLLILYLMSDLLLHLILSYKSFRMFISNLVMLRQIELCFILCYELCVVLQR